MMLRAQLRRVELRTLVAAAADGCALQASQDWVTRARVRLCCADLESKAQSCCEGQAHHHPALRRSRPWAVVKGYPTLTLGGR